MIRKMNPSDWEAVLKIYEQGLKTGISTFNIKAPSWDEWDRGHCREVRIVSEECGEITGWAAVSPTSAREVYRGVVEVSIYVEETQRGNGVGTALMNEIIERSRAQGYWSLYSAIISKNTASIALHKKCGFREIGYREKIAKDRFGVWQNSTLMELRL